MGTSSDQGRRSLVQQRWSLVVRFVVSAGVSVCMLADDGLRRDEPYHLRAQQPQRSQFGEWASGRDAG